MPTPITAVERRTWIRDADDHGLFEALEGTDTSPRANVEDLYGPLGEARRRAAVHPCSQHDLVPGLGEYRTHRSYTERAIFCVLGHDACADALTDAATFSSTLWDETIGAVWGHTIIGMDDPEHRLYRGLISQAFTKRALGGWQEDVMGPIVDGLIDRFADRGQADLAREFTLLFPMYVITELLGLPPTDVAQFNVWAAETIAVFYDFERAIAASKSLAVYLQPIIDERREEPGDDLISGLVQAELDGHRLDDEAIISFIRLLIVGGGETTFRSSGSLLLALLSDPGQLDAVRADRTLLAQAIEEGLRYEPPLTSISRLSTTETELAGVRIPANSVVECGIGTANRDESRWDDPDRFDLSRPRRLHLAFASGPHTCLGLHLARMETTIALNILFDRLPNLRPEQSADPRPVMRGMGLRSPSAVPVLFD